MNRGRGCQDLRELDLRTPILSLIGCLQSWGWGCEFGKGGSFEPKANCNGVQSRDP